MSLRFKLILAILTSSLLSVALVGIVAHERLMRNFDELAVERASRNFRGDVASYWLTYGSWDEGQSIESFHHFYVRRKALLTRMEKRFETGPRGQRLPPDTGDVREAKALPRWDLEEERKPQPNFSSESAPRLSFRDETAPFRFVLFDPSGRILNPREEAGRPATLDEQRHAVPIEVEGKFVAFASPMGIVNYNQTELNYIAAMWSAMSWGIAAAIVMAITLGLLLGNRLSHSLRKLTGAIESIQAGALRQQVEITSRDDIGLLARAFNKMSKALAISHDQLQASNKTIGELAEKLREQSIRDSLTGLFNRRHFDECALQMYDQSKRYGGALSVAIADIDFFKRINDDFSHPIGDAVLREVGILLQKWTRSSDIVARYGGEEFVFAFPENGLEAAMDCCERLRKNMEAHPWQNLHPDLRVTVSIGVTDNLSHLTMEDMLAAADHLLYEAKTTGRNCVRGRSKCDLSPAEVLQAEVLQAKAG